MPLNDSVSNGGRVTLFLSTGRCGTQWLASVLDEAYSDLARVTHEPIGADYRSKLCLRDRTGLEALRRDARFRSHLDLIRDTLATRHYIEVGWPLFGAIPLYLDAFGRIVQIVHLVRHPVRVAASYVTQGFFDFATTDTVKWLALDPFDPGIQQRDYQERWNELPPFEQALFHWTEINLYGEELSEVVSPESFYRVRFEDLVDPSSSDALEALIGFLGLPHRPHSVSLRQGRRDSYRARTVRKMKWWMIGDHPETVRLMRAYGYSMRDIDPVEFQKRYTFSGLGRQLRIIRRKLRSANVLPSSPDWA